MEGKRSGTNHVGVVGSSKGKGAPLGGMYRPQTGPGVSRPLHRVLIRILHPKNPSENFYYYIWIHSPLTRKNLGRNQMNSDRLQQIWEVTAMQNVSLTGTCNV